MGRQVTLSILGLYNYDPSLFSEMVFPSGFSEDEKETTINNILAECAELECLFASADTMKSMIGLWSKLNISVWQRIFTASQIVYNPIENYNRTELETISDDRTDTHSGNDVNRLSGSDGISVTTSNTESNTGTDTHTLSETNSGTDTTTNNITAYDANTLYTHDTSALQHGLSKSGSDALQHGHLITDTGSGSTTNTYGKTETLTHGEQIVHEGDITKNSHISGNIGVTTSQQMLEQEIEISAKLNVMAMIVNSFKERFCILVY